MADQQIANTEAALKKVGITCKVTKHKAVMTVDEHKAAAGSLEGTLTKNLLVKDKKKQLFLVVVAGDANVNMKSLLKKLGAKQALRFADEKTLMATLAVPQGHVTPLALINDKENKVAVAVDKALLESGKPILVHPCTNEATVGLSAADLKKFIASLGKELIELDLEGEDPAPAPAAKKDKKKKDNKQQQGKKGKQPKKQQAKKGKAGETMLGIEAKKAEDFPNWYQQVVTRSEMIEYYDISGCYILRPWSFQIWEEIQHFFDAEIKKLGVKNSYFPLFVSEKALNAEKDHIEGFAPEVAWVTKSGSSDLEHPIAVRPTSETIMYPAYAKWIRSHRDLPLRLNQWSNVVRWEFKSPTPFIRSREFLWQEGHSAFATKEQAEDEVLDILELYAQIYEDLLAVPVVKGKKTEEEKFAGGYYTTTVEAFIPATGRGIQGATSHCLGQNFAKMFHIEFEDEEGKKAMPWQNSWGCTTRTIGVMVMVHGDDKGLVLPPRIAPLQCIVVPVFYKEKDALKAESKNLVEQLKAIGVRAECDLRENYNPGWKYNNWEMKGVPLRLELGPRDLASKQVMVVRRDNGVKEAVPWADLNTRIPAILVEFQSSLLANARAKLNEKTISCTDWKSFNGALNKRCLALAPWCAEKPCELNIKERSGLAAEEEDEKEAEIQEEGEKLTGAAKSLCVPFAQPDLPEGTGCVGCGKTAVCWTLFGRSY